MAISYSPFSLPHVVPHRTWKKGEKGSYTFTPPCPSWIRSRHVLKGTRGHRDTTRAPPVRFELGWAGHARGGSSWFAFGKIHFIILRNGLRLPRFSPPFIMVFLIIRLPLMFSFSFYCGQYSSFKFINSKCKVHCCILGVSSVGSCALINRIHWGVSS